MRIVTEEDGRVSEYSINFYRDREEWFVSFRQACVNPRSHN